MTYKITMESLGRMTHLPDSHQLFGALTYLYAEKSGEDHASQFVQQVKEYQLDFSLSNLLPNNYYPIPKVYLSSRIEGEKLIYKNIKKRHFLQKKELTVACVNPKQIAQIYPFVQIIDSQQIHASIESLRYDLPGLPPNIFSVPEITVIEKNSKDSVKKITEFCFYFTGNAKIQPLLSFIEQAQVEERVFTLGPRSSQGLNLYTISAIKVEENLAFPEAELFLNLGLLLPNQFDFDRSFIEIYTSERRGYENYGERNQKTKKQFISFIGAGSIIAQENNQKEQISKSINTPSHLKNNAITFGQSFLYPMPDLKGVTYESFA